MNMMSKTLIALSTLALSSCVSVNEYPAQQSFDPPRSVAQDCIDATRPVRDFEVVSDREVIVDYLGNKQYRVMLKSSCPSVRKADQIGFSTGPDRYVGRSRRGPVYASPIDGSRRICGRGFDRIVIRDSFNDFTRPSEGCTIESIERLP